MQAAGLAHAGFSVASLLLGVGVFRLAKGTELHRVVGVAYVLSLFAVNVTALTIYRIFGRFGVFHALSVVNLAILLAGFGAAFLKRPRGAWLQYHYYFMGWSYVGLCAAAGAELAVRIPGVSFLAGVLVPTVVITVLGGARVQVSRRQTLARIGRARSLATGGPGEQGPSRDRDG